MASGSVNEKTAIVTGGGSGIGLEFVKLLHSKGCSVVIGDLGLSPEAEELVSKSSGPKVQFKKTDVTNRSQLTDPFTFAEKISAPDIVCPGADTLLAVFLADRYKTLTLTRNFSACMVRFLTQYRRQRLQDRRVNIDHPTKATRLVIKSFLKANKPGIVVYISSMGGQTTRLAVPIYCMMKAYINHFVQASAELDQK